MFSSYFKIEKHQNPPPEFSFIEMCLEDLSQDSRPLLNASFPTADILGVWTQMVSSPLCARPSQKPGKPQLGQRAAKQDHAGQGWSCRVRRAFAGRVFYMVLPLGVKSWLPGSEKWWLGLIPGFLRTWYHSSLKNANVLVPILPMSCFRSI